MHTTHTHTHTHYTNISFGRANINQLSATQKDLSLVVVFDTPTLC